MASAAMRSTTGRSQPCRKQSWLHIILLQFRTMVRPSAPGRCPGSKVFPYFVLSRNYNELSKDFEMFVGGTIDKKGLESLIIPNGEYARITIKPKLGFLWGLAIGEAKRYFYTKWLPKSRYSALNMEYEYHTEKSDGKSPEIDIFFAVKRK